MTDLRDSIKRTLDQSYGPFGDGMVERMAVSISRLPEIAQLQARIDELTEASHGLHDIAVQSLQKRSALWPELRKHRAALSQTKEPRT